ncbi:MAG: fibro-slime domain-containing protein [Fibrobacter sp.]|uniref:fibro-slime domain-containing protein n=1 Tax=Fibrobacter sp. TaxID=35828 RepID=UPI0025BD2301|nr:fibro-slime domain-containing protein [Fibrobacter sp.]MBR4783805.1 fibro-slime domain-containing protein [Fibrobacter sp.]
MGTAFFKAPSGWTQAIFTGQNNAAGAKTVTTTNAEGYFEINLSTIGAPDYANTFSITNSMTAGMNSYIVTDTVWMHQNPYDDNARANMTTLPCPTSDDGQVYIAEDVLNPGKTYIGSTAPDAKFFYVLVPEEAEWQSDELWISYTKNGVKKDTSMIPSPDYCGWHYMVFGTAPSDVVIYLRNDKTQQFGQAGLTSEGGELVPIDLELVFANYGNNVFFIPDENQRIEENPSGWHTEFPDTEGDCGYDLAAIIYDTDESLNTAFTSDGNPVGPGKCVGVFSGLVKKDLGPDGKPQYSGSPEAQMCFGNTPEEAERNFKAMFNYTPGVNEMQCYDMPFRHYGKDSRWGFDSDSTHYDLAGNIEHTVGCDADSTNCVYSGGFYPLEWPGDYDAYKYTADSATVTNGTNGDAGVVVINGVKMGPTPKARTKREAAAPVPLYDSVKAFDHYCNTAGWSGGIDCGATHEFQEGSQPPVWNWGIREDWQKMNKGKKLLRNQQYCFQTHASFTYNESQEFTFRGDDDIWVFINKKLAVDNGGAHLAAPGHVVLKDLNKSTAYGPGFLEPGKDYPIDIFFCDRRRTMTNVIIKTNMYIKQSVGIFSIPDSLPNGGVQYTVCVEKTGGGDCASTVLGSIGGDDQEPDTTCAGDISTPIHYYITNRKKQIPAGCSDCDNLPTGGTVHGGINLSVPGMPVVDEDRMIGLPPGNYRLWFEVGEKKGSVRFRVKGNLGIVTKDVKFENADNDVSVYPANTWWKFVGTALAGTRIPIYISAPDADNNVDLPSAANQNYQLTLTEGATLYKTKDSNTPLVVPYSGKVDSTGIDTLWVDVPLAGLMSSSQEIKASVGNTSAILTFYAPKLDFGVPVTKDADGNVTEWKWMTRDPDVDEDGDEYFHWVGSDVDFYLVVRDPSSGLVCKECDFSIDALGKSEGLEIQVNPFEDGVSLVRVRSSKEYSTDTASMSVGSVDNNGIAAPYGNMHFYKPPAPMPLIVDIFDVKGAPLGEMNIPAQYHSESADYLDGRADSLAIIYDRKIDRDSVPKFVCLNFDEDNLTKINPVQLGLSNNKRDTLMECSTQFDSAAVWKAFERSPDNGRTLVFSVDSSFSVDVKTLVTRENKVASFTEYEWKHRPVRTFFEKGLTDRIAPVILSARAIAEKDGGEYDQVRIVVSEPVIFTDANNGTKAFTYYLNSAIDVRELQRFTHATAQGRPQDRRDTLTMRYKNTDVQNPTPHVGDYVRFRADAFMWTDTSNGVAAGSDTLRMASDAEMHWNSPTDYNSTARLPSPWVQVVGDAKISVTTISFNYANQENITSATPVGTVFPVKTNENLEDIKAKYPTTLGHFVQSDMGAIIGSDDSYASVDKNEVYFNYEVDYYTNLGAFVARQSGKIKCTDKFFSADPDHTPDGMGDCVKNPRNFFIAWNMLSKQKRLVGTGAYITKYSSYVKVGNVGKKAKKELTEVWGVKRGKGKVKK